MQQKIHLVKIKYLVYLYMSCGNYCFQRQWECRPGKLKRLSEVQQQPSPTRDYGSDGARSNYVMRRVVRTNATRNKLQEISGFGSSFRIEKITFNISMWNGWRNRDLAPCISFQLRQWW